MFALWFGTYRLLSGQVLPPLHDDIAVRGRDLHAVALASQLLGGDQRGAGAAKRLVDVVAAARVCLDEEGWKIRRKRRLMRYSVWNLSCADLQHIARPRKSLASVSSFLSDADIPTSSLAAVGHIVESVVRFDRNGERVKRKPF